mgnify:CR=1 FL=1
MPFTRYRRRYNYAPRKRMAYGRSRTTRRVPGLATRPRMMSYALARKRYNQVSTKTFWFKTNGTINVDNQAFKFIEWRVNALLPTVNPQGWAEATAMFDQYKVLGMTYRLFPANVGTEPTGVDQTGPFQSPQPVNRGNHCLWIDQRFDGAVQQPTSISNVINTASARLINPRRPYKISIWRPTGKPKWGSTRAIATVPDDWTGVINHIIEGATTLPPGNPQPTIPIWYYTLQWKVVFRGRQDD